MKKLHFGCGRNILEGFINVDCQKAKGISLSFDFDVFPYPFKNNSFDFIFSENVLEHLDRPQKVFDELWRISKPNAIIHLKVPVWNHSFAYNDPDHRHYFNERAIEVLCKIKSTYHHKNSPQFEILELKKISVGWRRYLPYFVRSIMDKFLINTFAQIESKIKVIK